MVPNNYIMYNLFLISINLCTITFLLYNNVFIGEIYNMLKNISEELITNRMMNQRLCNKIDSLKNDFTKFADQISVPTIGFTDDIEDSLFLELFPFSTKDDVLKCETILQKDNNIKQKFVSLNCI